MNTIIDIIERSQMRHALQKGHELQNLDALSHRPVALVKNEGSETGSANIDSRASWKDEMVTAARWPRSTGRDVGPNRPTVGERLRYGRSLAMGLGSSKQQLQSGERG